MKDVTLTLCNKSFKLNELPLNKEDLGLLLELLGFDVDYSCTIPQFFIKTLNSIATLEEREFFQVFNDFVSFDQQTKNEYKEALAKFKIANRNLN